jgi:hypothetical protein
MVEDLQKGQSSPDASQPEERRNVQHRAVRDEHTEHFNHKRKLCSTSCDGLSARAAAVGGETADVDRMPQ